MTFELILAIAGVVLVVVLVGLFLWSRRVVDDPQYYRQLITRAENAATDAQNQAARKLYIRVVKGVHRVPSHTPELKDVLGQALLAAGKIDREANRLPDALNFYREAVQLVPASADVIALVAADYAGRIDMSPRAINAYMLHLTCIRGAEPVEDPTYHLLQSQCRIPETADAARYQAIVSLATRIIEADANREWAHYALGQAQALLGRIAKAIDALKIAEKLAPNRAETPFHLGRLYLAQKQDDEAYQSFQRSLRNDPNQPDALYQVGQILVRRAEAKGPSHAQALDEATTVLRRATELAPERAEVWSLRGHVDVARGDIHAAKDALARAATLVPSNAVYQMALAEVLILLNDSPAAVAALRAAVAADPRHITAHHTLAELLFEARQFVEAEEHYRKALALDQTRDADRIGLGRTLYELGRPAEVIEVLSKVANLPAEALYALARSYSLIGDFAKAIGKYKQWLEQHGSDVDVHYSLGCAYARLGDWPAAGQAFERAEREADKRGHGRGDIALQYGSALLAAGRVSDARQVYALAATRDPRNATIAYAQGMVAVREEDLIRAQRAFERALSLDASFGGAYLGLGLVNEATSNLAQAIAAYTKATQCPAVTAGPFPVQALATLRLGVVQAKEGNWKAALAPLQIACAGEMHSHEAVFYLGLSHAQLGQYTEALKTWERLSPPFSEDLTLKANIAIVLYRLGRQHFDGGDYAEAIICWTRLHNQHPDVSEFRDCLTEAHFRLGAKQLAAAVQSAEVRARARENLEQAVSLEPEDLRPHYYMGIAALIDRDFDGAICHFDNLAKEAPEDHRFRYYLAMSLVAKGAIDAAMPLLDDLEPVAYRYHPGLRILHGNAAVKQGRWADAFESYVQMLPRQRENRVDEERA